MTDLAGPLTEHPKVRANYESLMPLGRVGTPEEVARAVCFLAPASSTQENLP